VAERYEIQALQKLNERDRAQVRRFLSGDTGAPVLPNEAESYFREKENIVHAAYSGNRMIGLAFSRIQSNGRGGMDTRLIHQQIRDNTIRIKLRLESFNWLRKQGIRHASIPVINTKLMDHFHQMGFRSTDKQGKDFERFHLDLSVPTTFECLQTRLGKKARPV